jgi:tetratricopeptide (TPR) repeat protein
MFQLPPGSLRLLKGAFRPRLTQWLVFSLFALSGALAKDIPVTGILIYSNSGSLAYVQVTDFLVNGKTELRACKGSGGISKSEYKNLARINLATVRTLERLPDGSLVAAIGDAPVSCVVPGNFKFDKDGALSQADLAEKSTYTGQATGSSPAGQRTLPPFAAGVKMVFGSATDLEQAEYVLAERAQAISSWQTYLTQYPAGTHVEQAKMSLLALLVNDGTVKLGSYKTSSGSSAPAYADLKAARERADQAIELQPNNEPANKLKNDVRAELKIQCDNASAKLQAFRDAAHARRHGYPLLVSAKDLSDHVTSIDSKYQPGVGLAAAVAGETRALDATIQAANSQVTSHLYDTAYATIDKYLSFGDEEPRLKEIVGAAYKYHLDKGCAEANAGSWENAVADLKKASEILPTDESKTELAKAEAGLLAMQNKTAADKALAISKERVNEKDIIGAYEVLADLNEARRALVREQMNALQDAYVQSATQRAKELQSAHTPIRGRADEDGVRMAYAYLQRASKLSDNPQIGLKLEVMGETISSYYVDLAKKYLNKPLSSGVGLGWSYLNEASQYKPNLDVVHDLMTSNNAAYQMRARLSIGVLFRDQTSRRDSAGFADQLQQAFATGLETSGLPVKVILPGTAGTLEPNFQFVGEILQHRPIHSAKKETLQSQYRSGSHEMPNEAWNKADQEFEAATLNLQKTQGALMMAQGKNNKKQIQEADAALTAVQATVQEARAKMNALPKTVTDSVVSPYNYTQTTLELTNIVELSFRILDSSRNTLGKPIKVTKGDQPKKFVILDNIKPDDTTGLKEVDAQPDETQLMTDIEIEARDTMVKAARDKVQELPQKILVQARAQTANNDMDGAGELYVLYLNCTAAASTPERIEAARFLSTNFNIRNTLNLRASTQ